MNMFNKVKMLAAITAIAAAPSASAFALYDMADITAPTKAIQLIYSSEYNSLLIKNTASAIKVVNTATDTVSSTRLANSWFTGMSLSPSGRYVYAADYGGENIGYGKPLSTSYVQRFDLATNTWESKSAYIAGGIAATADDQFVLKSNDQWITLTNNAWGTGSAVTQLNSSSGYWTPGYYAGVYAGDIVYDPTSGRTLHGNSGLSSEDLQAFKISSNNDFIKQEGSGFYGSAQSYGGTLVLASDASVLYDGKLQVEALDVTHNLHVFPENIYAATADLAFGDGDYYDAHTGLLLGTLGFSSTVYGVDQTGNSFWAYDSANNKLHYFAVSASSAPIPVPAAAWLFASALTGLAGIARKRKATR